MLYRFLFVLLLFSGSAVAQQQELLPENHCVTDEERELYNLINGYRNSQQLDSIAFSSSLSYVARVHSMDLKRNRPDFGGCNLHSWSDKGKWKPCCYAKDEKRVSCMTLKPRELTLYKSVAYEVVYSATEGESPQEVFEFWKGIPLMNDYLLNKGKWEKPWNALGVGIYGEYISVWFGEAKDPAGSVVFCSSKISEPSVTSNSTQKGDTLSDQTKVVVIQSTVIDTLVSVNPAKVEENQHNIESNYAIQTESEQREFYIVVGNTGTENQAIEEVNKLRSRGYKNAGYLVTTSFYRIIIDKFKEESRAYSSLAEVRKKFPDAWLLKPPSKNN